MTQFTNIRIPSDCVMDPLLVPLANKLALDKPNWVFKAKMSARGNRYRHTSAVHEGPDLQPNTFYIRDLDVHDGNEELGTIGVDWAYRRGSTQRYLWYVESWRIIRERGSANMKTSMKMDIIVREAKKVFKPKALDELMNASKPKLNSGWWHSMREIMTPFSRLQGIKSTEDLQLYAFCIANNREVDMSKFDHLLKQLRSTEFETMIANYELGASMETLASSNQVLDVVIHDGLFIVSEINSAEHRRMAYEEMPIPWQERIAVLQLVNDHEIVRNTGYRLNETHFRIIK